MARPEFNSICRLCIQLLETEKVSPIFNNELYDDKISLSERIRYCSSVEVSEDDGLPPQICASCLVKLNQSFIFRNQCVLADITLKRLVNNVTFNLNEIPTLLKIDIENQIIESDTTSFEYKEDDILEEETNCLKEEESIDGYDNSKTGRHKKTIKKFKDKLVQSVKIFERNTEEDSCTGNRQNKVDDLISVCSQEIQSSKKKRGRHKKIDSEGDSQKVKKSRTPNKKKEMLNKFNDVVDTERETEDFTIEPDMFSLNNVKTGTNTQNENIDLHVEKFQRKPIKKMAKPKTLGLKRGKTKKLGIVKEKPSSYTCDYCQKVYPSEGGWRYHIHTMHNENYQPFICDLCGQAFKVKKNLEGHKNSIHFHLKLHLCDLCGRGFASKYALKVHKIWHNDEKNFTCDICGTKFRTRGKMNTHRSIHGGPKKFMCHICSRDFRWKKDFEIHMRTHTGEKPFKCSHCGKAFASLTNMKKHERNHLEKLELTKTTEPLGGMTSIPTDDRLYKSELMDFGYVAEDVRNRDINLI